MDNFKAWCGFGRGVNRLIIVYFMKLYIDTRDSKKLILKITDRKRTLTLIEQNEKAKADSILLALEKLMSGNNLKFTDIKSIECEKKAGSFTGTRVGVAIANALSFSLQVPINKMAVATLENPVY